LRRPQPVSRPLFLTPPTCPSSKTAAEPRRQWMRLKQ
jgi:hypothetical protein